MFFCGLCVLGYIVIAELERAIFYEKSGFVTYICSTIPVFGLCVGSKENPQPHPLRPQLNLLTKVGPLAYRTRELH